MITLPANFIDNILDVMSDTFSDLLPLILLILGITLGAWILSSILWNWKEREMDNYLKRK